MSSHGCNDGLPYTRSRISGHSREGRWGICCSVLTMPSIAPPRAARLCRCVQSTWYCHLSSACLLAGSLPGCGRDWGQRAHCCCPRCPSSVILAACCHPGRMLPSPAPGNCSWLSETEGRTPRRRPLLAGRLLGLADAGFSTTSPSGWRSVDTPQPIAQASGCAKSCGAGWAGVRGALLHTLRSGAFETLRQG